MLRHINIKIYGRVQGVDFRFQAQRMARSLGVKGFVKNTDDGEVYIEAEAEGGILEKFRNWCNAGPRFSRVDKVEITEGAVVGFEKFEAVRQ